MFELNRGYTGYDTQGMLEKVGITKTTIRSGEGVLGVNWDKMAFAQTSASISCTVVAVN